MRNFQLLFFCFPFLLMAQPDTDVHLFKLSTVNGSYSVSEGLNVSNNKGYDNQPSFYNDNILLFASTRNGQTDIAKYNIRDKKINYINSTPNGSEYSPLKITGQKAVSSIRLDKDGKQLLYRYDFNTGKDNILVEDLVIGYYVWLSKEELASFVLGDQSSLVISNIKNKTNKTLAKNIGRSLHKIPNSNLFSYINKNEDVWSINSMNPKTGESKKIINTLPQTEDMCWLIDGTILMPKGNTIYKFNPKTDTNWNVFKVFERGDLQNITRITTNAIGTLMALVSDVSPEQIVQEQVEAYNNRDLDAFMATYSDNVVINYFPEKIRYENKAKMRERFVNYFKTTPDLNCTIKNRMVLGNKVIDEEYILANGEYRSAVAIYEVNGGKITKVTFIKPENKEDPLPIVNKQLTAYNERKIDAFLQTYTKDVTLNTFPNTQTSKGLDPMRNTYGGMFDRIPDLNAEIVKRIAIGNTVIDKEKVTVNGNTFYAIAIYEVNNGLIDRVTFIQ
ncbi:nuclear transport factor 2 family protein [Winogradskyella immobilis]|uniref:Nuclear transport factor 2 family protein n=1 Tax=Winogradskyella immobilis TaxID=2816852 RepID=A0ABS8EJZ7_9FLAO|nr:nuclear transport factor 2 family protein [Winogradskyella immobilis]MCC1483526.1 nuclear transport factor 2 family protein [Winogradskyella immobilis]MCG0015620.1 nuclear transport factor 2 family protein [Winogradskyella immobilis]